MDSITKSSHVVDIGNQGLQIEDKKKIRNEKNPKRLCFICKWQSLKELFGRRDIVL